MVLWRWRGHAGAGDWRDVVVLLGSEVGGAVSYQALNLGVYKA